ncbi:MAG: protein GumC [Deltaproteobacteria bacterium]|nr:MAG: protein GumC [Deltaproteobacteria bacterium]
MNNITGNPQLKPEQIIEIGLRYRWVFVISIAFFLSFGLVTTFMSTRIYEASTLILVQPQKVPQTFVRSVVSTGIQARISTISQQIMSRSNLEKIIDQFGLFVDKDKKMFLEDKIKLLRERIVVRISHDRNRGSEAFTIKYKGDDPRRVMKITNTLASYFMDENLKVREAQAVGTSEFLDVELDKTREKLELMERKLSTYRAKHIGALPEELDSNLRTLDRLQKELESKQNLLRDTKNNISTLKKQMAEQSKKNFSSFQLESNEFEDEAVFSEDEKKLNILQNALDSLLLRYTKKHPDVAKINKKIEKLKDKISKDKEKASSGKKKKETEEETSNFDESVTTMLFETQINEVKKEVNALIVEIKSIENKMKIYQKRVDETPQREQDLQSLKRDYNNIQAIYNSLLDRKLEAEISVNMEKKQKGEQFRIIDHARIPERPISPNVTKRFVLFLGAGFAVAGGISFLLFIFDNKIRRNDEIEVDLGLPVISQIAPIVSSQEAFQHNIKNMGFVFFCLYDVFLFAAFLALNNYGIGRAVDLIKSFI